MTKHGTLHQEHAPDVEVVQQVHTDGTVDFVDTHALGGALENMPKGYYTSMNFIGTVVVSYSFVCLKFGHLLNLEPRLSVQPAFVPISDGYYLLIHSYLSTKTLALLQILDGLPPFGHLDLPSAFSLWDA